MYEYPELNSINAMDKELFNALKHDPLLYQCYMNYYHNYNPKPFEYKKFYVYLSYMALRMSQQHMNASVINAERSVNPPVFIQQEDSFYNKKKIDNFILKESKGYWQKLWDAILGR